MITKQYEQILEELEAGERNSIARAIFKALQTNPTGLTRPQLIALIFQRQPKPNLNNDSGDRKIRDTIASMRDRMIPIVSTSGEAGYRLDDSDDARRAMLAEWISRRNSLNDKIKLACRAWAIPMQYSEPETATQARLL
jgi:hypothetical protein